MLSKQRASGRLETVEACNAMKAESFRKLPDEIEIWRFREVLIKLGASMGLSGGAVVYALDLMGILTESDWRGDGRAVTFHSVRAYARKVGKSERTICEYERQLIAAGLAHRTVKHARRHGGYGDEARRTGLDWRAFGAAMPDLLIKLKQREVLEHHRLDLEARIRAERRIAFGLVEGLEEGRALTFFERLKALGIQRLRNTLDLPDLQQRLAGLIVLRGEIQQEFEVTRVDNASVLPQESVQSEVLSGLIDTTNNPSYPTDIRSVNSQTPPNGDDTNLTERPNGRSGLESKPRGGRRSDEPKIVSRGDNSVVEANCDIDAVPLTEIWKAAPTGWKSALGREVEISWPALIELADHFAPQLGVSPYAWSKALRVLGPSEAALGLMVLDRNRDHPTRPVVSVGGALVGMIRRAERGDFNLVPSIYGIIGRSKSANGEVSAHVRG